MSDPMTSHPVPADHGWKRWVVGARPRTLPAAVAPVIVGTAAAIDEARVWVFLCALGVALFVQIATNYANDYSDGVRGTDDPGSRIGPPRLVGSNLATPSEVKGAMLVAFAATALAGLPLVLFVDWKLILVGLAAIAAGWFYTGGPNPYGYAGYGELFVFVFFGLVATIGSYYVQTETVGWLVVGCAIAMGSLATALLVVNNLRDIPSDLESSKNTLAVRIGDLPTRVMYVVLLVVPFLLVPFLAGLSGHPFAALALVALVIAREPVVTVLSGAQGADLLPVLAKTGVVQLVYALGLSLGLVIGVG